MEIDVKGNDYFDHYGVAGHLPQSIRINKYYGIIGRGLTNDIGVYGIVGAASARSQTGVYGEDAPNEYKTLDFGSAPVGGFGVKGTFYRRGAFQAGAMTQFTWVGELSAKRHIYDFQYATANINNFMEMHILIGGVYQVRPWCSVYGGPLMHVIRGDFRGQGRCTYCGITNEVDRDIQQSSWFGGNVGMQVRCNNGALIAVEYTHTAHADGIGTGFMIPL